MRKSSRSKFTSTCSDYIIVLSIGHMLQMQGGCVTHLLPVGEELKRSQRVLKSFTPSTVTSLIILTHTHDEDELSPITSEP